MALLIDADIIAYRAASSVEKEIEFEPDVWVMQTDLKDAHDSFQERLDGLLKQTSQTGYILCFSHGANFRKQLSPDYQANRTSRKPMGFKPFVQQLKEKHHNCVVMPRLEADDALGILATGPDRAEHVIWSADKDLMQVPGRHLVDGDEVFVTQAEGDHFFLTQVLTGDTVDNYKGLPGIGPAKAKLILDNPDKDNMPRTVGEMWSRIVNAYAKGNLTEADAILQARMAFILRTPNWISTTEKIRLWAPPK